MALFQYQQNLQGLSTSEQISQWLSITIKELSRLLNGRLSTDNFKCQISEVNFERTNVDTAVDHTLNAVPDGFILIRTFNKNMNVYDGAGPWTATRVYLRSNVVGKTKVLIF